jgi:hypothetical protein
MPNGVLTSAVAHSLQCEFNKQGCDVLHDHGQEDGDFPENLGKIRSWSGSSLKSETLLADLDMAIVSHVGKKIYALIEIEETTDKPKVILGDVLATLLGNGIAFQGKLDLQVGEWTTLIIMAYDAHQLHGDRLVFLSEQANLLKEKLSTPNAAIGRIILDTYTSKMELEDKLKQHVYDAINFQGN